MEDSNGGSKGDSKWGIVMGEGKGVDSNGG